MSFKQLLLDLIVFYIPCTRKYMEARILGELCNKEDLTENLTGRQLDDGPLALPSLHIVSSTEDRKVDA